MAKINGRAGINGQTKVVGIFGDPVGHSFSPAMHNAAFHRRGLNFCYLPFQVSREGLPAAMRAITAMGLAGVNITAPHKEAAVAFLQEMSPDVRFLQAVNTVKNVAGRLSGYNTDVDGFSFLLTRNFDTDFKKACLLGAGGAARAVALALARAGVKKLVIANRTIKRADKLARQLCREGLFAPGDLEIISLERENIKPALAGSLVINGLSVDPVELAIVTPGGLSAGQGAIDLRYNPPLPPFLCAAHACGLPATNGLGMLLGQGLKAFEIFTGETAPAEAMQEMLNNLQQVHPSGGGKVPGKECIKPSKNIFLTGFMGSGKTTAGRLLAERLKLEFYDCDEIIAATQEMNIEGIFQDKGEEYFRREETKLIKRLVDKPPGSCVIATGGGVVLREVNLAAMEEQGIIIFLEISPQEAFFRVGSAQGRPLLAGEDLPARIGELLRQREPYYQRAHFRINTDGKTPEQVVDAIIRVLDSGTF